MSDETMIGNLPDVDSYLDGFGGDERTPLEPLADGWYDGTIIEFTDRKGNTYPRDEAIKNQRTIVMAIELPDGTFGTRKLIVRGNYKPELITEQVAAAVKQAQKEETLWSGDNALKAAYFSLRLIGGLRKAAKGQGRTFTRDGEGYTIQNLVNMPLRVNLTTEEDQRYGKRNVLNSFSPFDAAKS